jgi:hypothetical protein
MYGLAVLKDSCQYISAAQNLKKIKQFFTMCSDFLLSLSQFSPFISLSAVLICMIRLTFSHLFHFKPEDILKVASRIGEAKTEGIKTYIREE